MSGHVFVDETKHRQYLLVAAVVLPADLDVIRKVVRELVLPGQRRVHMKNENDGRKRCIVAAIADAEVRATVYDAGLRYRTERDRRGACLRGLVDDTARRGDTMLVLEQDDSLLRWDNQQLVDLTRGAGCREMLRYEHRRACSEPLLSIPDAIAWCWAKGGSWRRQVGPAVERVRTV